MELGGIFLEGGVVFRELSGAAGTGDPKFLSLPWDVPGGKGNSHCRFSSLQLGAFTDPKILSFPWIKVEPGCAWMPKFLSLPWDVPEGKGNFHFRRPPNLCPFPIPGMCQVKKGILIPQSLILPEERGGGVGMMKQPELLQPGIGKLEQQPHLGHGEGGKTLRKWLKLFQRKIRKASCAKNPLFHPICLQQNSLGATKTLRNRSRKGESLPSVAVPLPRRTWSSSLGFPGMRKRLWMPG